MSKLGRRARVALPAVIGLTTALVTAMITWWLVRGDVARWTSTGFGTEPELKFVFTFTFVAGLVSFLVARRLVRGPMVQCREWTLTVPQIEPRAITYRELEAPSVGDSSNAWAAAGTRSA